MARRRKSGFYDLVEVAAKLPWWVSIALALVSYVWLSSVAIRPIPPPEPGARITAQTASGMVRGFASLGRYVLPVVFVVGAGVSAYRRHRRKQLHLQACGEQGASAIDGMNWHEFEMLVGEGFRERGFSVVETGGGGADGGVDLVVRKGNERFLVQCKQWRAQRVGVAIVRELYGVMAAKGAAGGFVVTSGTFTPDAKAFAGGRNIELIEGAELTAMLKRGRSAPPVGAANKGVPPKAGDRDTAPLCPRCNATMVQRIAKKGASAGEPFWGCTKYPACRGTR